jgi:nitrile hydratase beta subunit
MGGMHGFGPVIRGSGDRDLDEPLFHDAWEGRTFGLMVATAVTGLRAGSIRPGIEEIAPATYLASSYYERWARSVEAGLLAAGTLTAAELDAWAATVAPGDRPTRSQATAPDLVAAVRAVLDAPTTTSGEPVAAAFGLGDRVMVRRLAPAGHHRCPRYLRGVTGRVERVNGGWPPPGEETAAPEAVYRVRFEPGDVWGEDAEPGVLFVDLWERYLSRSEER